MLTLFYAQYWSERPHEKLQGEQNHASMLSNLNALIRVLESLAAGEKDGDAQRVVVERMMVSKFGLCRECRVDLTFQVLVDQREQTRILEASPLLCGQSVLQSELD